MFYFSGTDLEVAGASPETLVKLENGTLHTFPMAGTRPRGRDETEDKALEKELLDAINATGFGPQGFGGATTCLGTTC